MIDDLREQVAILTRQNEVEALDREWEAERQSLMITGKHGHTHVPTKSGTVIGGFIVSGFGILWTIFAVGITSQIPVGFAKMFPLFGVIFVLAGIAMSIQAYRKAEQYERAERRYRQRRATLLDRLDDHES